MPTTATVISPYPEAPVASLLAMLRRPTKRRHNNHWHRRGAKRPTNEYKPKVSSIVAPHTVVGVLLRVGGGRRRRDTQSLHCVLMSESRVGSQH